MAFDVGTHFDRDYRNTLNNKINEMDTDRARVESESKTRDTNNQTANSARMTQIEQDSITRDNDHKNSTTAHSAQNITYAGNVPSVSNAKDAIDKAYERAGNIIADSGTSSTEIVDARLSPDGTAHTVLKDRLDRMETKQLDSERHTQTLVHGKNLITRDSDSASSPLKVEFYPEHRINYAEGNFEKQGKWDANLAISTSTYKFGTSSGKIDNSAGTGLKISYNFQKMYVSKNYLLVGGWIKSSGTTADASIILLGYNSDGTRNNADNLTLRKINIGTDWIFVYAKVDRTADTSAWYQLRLDVESYGTAADIVYFDGLIVEKLTSTQYNDIGVTVTETSKPSITDLYNYIEGIKGVKNPVLKVSGSQFISPFTQWTLGDGAEVVAPYHLKHVNTGNTYSYMEFRGVKGQQYTLKGTIKDTYVVVAKSASGGSQVANINSTTLAEKSVTFTFPNDVDVLYVSALRYGSNNYNMEVKDLMLSLGTTALPFTEKNDSYLYAETTLYGNELKKDILYEKEGQWYKEKNWQTVSLDGSLSWTYHLDYTGYKLVYHNLQVTGYSSTPIFAEKYDGKILLNATANDGTDRTTIGSNGTLVYISISDIDSGWTDAMTPTAKMIKGYFNGWKYTGNGTTHSWVSLVDGTVAPTQTEDYVSANQAPSYKNYFLLYQRSTPVTEPVTVEGSLNVPSGGAIVEVGTGVVVREVTNPVYSSAYKRYYINTVSGIDANVGDSRLKYRLKKSIKVYKNGKEDNSWKELTTGTAYGDKAIYIDETLYDSTAEYTVTYELLDKYAFTNNLNNVKAVYSSSMKSSFDRTVEKVSDVATEVSFHARQIYDLMVKTKNL